MLVKIVLFKMIYYKTNIIVKPDINKFKKDNKFVDKVWIINLD
jgi:hypothetical protein